MLERVLKLKVGLKLIFCAKLILIARMPEDRSNTYKQPSTTEKPYALVVVVVGHCIHERRPRVMEPSLKAGTGN
eukprot:5785737-Heterocapsa_arctica.AAC.1